MSDDNYKLSNVTGESWVRAKRIVIENPLNGRVVAKFVEEKVVNVDQGEQFFKDMGVLEIDPAPTTMAETIPVLDPTTGEKTGETVTYGELYTLLKSAYIHFALRRDVPPESAPPPPQATDQINDEGV